MINDDCKFDEYIHLRFGKFGKFIQANCKFRTVSNHESRIVWRRLYRYIDLFISLKNTHVESFTHCIGRRCGGARMIRLSFELRPSARDYFEDCSFARKKDDKNN